MGSRDRFCGLAREVNNWVEAGFPAGICPHTYIRTFSLIIISIAYIYRKAFKHTHTSILSAQEDNFLFPSTYIIPPPLVPALEWSPLGAAAKHSP